MEKIFKIKRGGNPPRPRHKITKKTDPRAAETTPRTRYAVSYTQPTLPAAAAVCDFVVVGSLKK
ncbi:MAG: hypothetical protein MPK03_07085, partial [Alphaproteobacteria bacterium]|nr:hypothetical protein [Alphaproteobacteria bacterium]